MQGITHVLNIGQSSASLAQLFELDILEGLSSQPKYIPSKYLYDARGSKLHEQIASLEDYYPTSCELEILQKRKKDIREIASDKPFRLIEFGVGNPQKTQVLIQHFLEHGLEFEYYLADSCPEMIQLTVKALEEKYRPNSVHIVGVVADYSQVLKWLNTQSSMKNILVFLGSSLGNFNLHQLQHFLREVWMSLTNEDSVLIGFDLKKDFSILKKTYNDNDGSIQEFYLNILDRLNRELSGNFDRNKFIHHAFYNPAEGRIENWLISTQQQTVALDKLQKSFSLEPGEGIHIENCYKYSLRSIEELAESLGFGIDKELIDSKGYFVDAIWHVNKACQETSV